METILFEVDTMNSLFEYSDSLNAPYECFSADSARNSYFPVRPHWHYFAELLYFQEGSGIITCDNQTYYTSPGDLVLFLPQTIHSIYIATDVPLRYCVLKFDLGQLFPATDHSSSTFSGIHIPSLFAHAREDKNASVYLTAEQLSNLSMEELFIRCITEMEHQHFGYRMMIRSCIQTILLEIIRIWRENGFDTDQAFAPPKDSDFLASITEYIDTHAHLPLKVEDLAERCHMSYSYFAKTFRETYGQSCKKYIEFIRICKAEDLLRFTNLDLNYISQETGFSDCSHFIRVFKQQKGITPKQFRMKL